MTSVNHPVGQPDPAAHGATPTDAERHERAEKDRVEKERQEQDKSAGPITSGLATSPQRKAARTVKSHIGVDSGAMGSYSYVVLPEGWNRNRTLTVDGVAVEHVGEDKDGCWLYRAM